MITGGFGVRAGSGRAGVLYEVTALRREVTGRYESVRATLLIAAGRRVPEIARSLEDAARLLELRTGIYARAARAAATHRRRPADQAKLLPNLQSTTGQKG